MVCEQLGIIFRLISQEIMLSAEQSGHANMAGAKFTIY
jgi:hypothetical protein